ncbi:DUF6884 domain-containing protein [Rhodococcus opacus]|uniref:DUF6884 domain-containing protein n=1 Tax=Rhodococcus opacus TaxID=37919 RepID=UPI0024735CD3|nr:DUF6884 domain-containing protein [Rhodococcus opacus]MDH6289424.1 hypothetical protein [Rhodococcus opacus]
MPELENLQSSNPRGLPCPDDGLACRFWMHIRQALAIGRELGPVGYLDWRQCAEFSGTQIIGGNPVEKRDLGATIVGDVINTAPVAQWSSLTEKLSGISTSIRLRWDELEDVVGELPPSASKHRTWWSGDRPHVREWQSAGFSVGDVRLGTEVTFIRTPAEDATAHKAGPVASPEPSAPATNNSDNAEQPDLLLVTCVKTKLDVPAAAKDLYISSLFKKQRAYAEVRSIPWFILSAEHGLVAPDDWLAPYERYLPDTPPTYRAAWGAWAVERLELLAGPLRDKVVEIHAGAPYINVIADHLTSKGATVVNRLEGLAMGARLQWYASFDPHSEGVLVSQNENAHEATSSFVTMLLDESQAVEPTEFLGYNGEGLRVPGLYSWWVDDSGASDLTIGLDTQVTRGLIYAGLAGATRWPSGKRSSNTLWSRISGMHLGGRHEFSTFRKTLGSILANTAGSASIDEEALTVWMKQHLKVLTVPYVDADTLGKLEDDVLTSIDPPLNLQGMDPSPIRKRLKELRRNHR